MCIFTVLLINLICTYVIPDLSVLVSSSLEEISEHNQPFWRRKLATLTPDLPVQRLVIHHGEILNSCKSQNTTQRVSSIKKCNLTTIRRKGTKFLDRNFKPKTSKHTRNLLLNCSRRPVIFVIIFLCFPCSSHTNRYYLLHSFISIQP